MVFGLLPLALLLGDPPQLVIGACLFVAIVEVDLGLQGLLVILLCLLPLALLLGHDPQVVIGAGLPCTPLAFL